MARKCVRNKSNECRTCVCDGHAFPYHRIINGTHQRPSIQFHRFDEEQRNFIEPPFDFYHVILKCLFVATSFETYLIKPLYYNICVRTAVVVRLTASGFFHLANNVWFERWHTLGVLGHTHKSKHSSQNMHATFIDCCLMNSLFVIVAVVFSLHTHFFLVWFGFSLALQHSCTEALSNWYRIYK